MRHVARREWVVRRECPSDKASIRTAGDAYDNALMEAINGLYEAEAIRTTVLHPGPLKTIADVAYATAAWVDW
jgi:putative transposase